MANYCDGKKTEEPTEVQVVGNPKDLIKNRVKSRLTPANYTLSGVVQIHGASNVQLGHNLTVSQATPKPVQLKDPSTVNQETLQRLCESKKEVTARHKMLVSQNVGSDWRFLGKELAGFSNAQMDQFEENFKADKYSFEEMIYQLLLKWEDCSVEEPTIAKLARALHKCKMHAALHELARLEKSP